MRIKEKLQAVIRSIREMPDPEEVPALLQHTIEELIDADIMGLELSLCVHYIKQELSKCLLEADSGELENIRAATRWLWGFECVFGKNVYHFELN
ncbi:MAG: hypothetical protein AB1458_12640 [Bacteroidota bacterium]